MRTHAHSFVGNHKTSCSSFRLIFTSILKQQPQEKPLIAVSPVALLFVFAYQLARRFLLARQSVPRDAPPRASERPHMASRVTTSMPLSPVRG